MRRAAASRAGRTGASPAGWSRRPWRAAAPLIASPRRRRRAPASGSSCGAAGPSTPRRRHEACARHPRASGSRRHAACAQSARRRGSAPRLGAALRARRPLGEFAPGTRARVVYNGMDVERIVRAAAAPLPAGMAPGGGPTVGMVGHLDARKNPALLLEAIAEVRAAVPGARALLVGAFRDPAYERSVRERARTLGLADAVAVTGFLPNPFPIVERLDVLAHPALRDPFPPALLEGLALARPLVAG